MVTDTGLRALVDRFGRAHAQAVWDAGLASIAEIDQIIRTERIDADFHWVDGYLHLPPSATAADATALEKETALANELGFDAELVARVPIAGALCCTQEARSVSRTDGGRLRHAGTS